MKLFRTNITAVVTVALLVTSIVVISHLGFGIGADVEAKKNIRVIVFQVLDLPNQTQAQVQAVIQ